MCEIQSSSQRVTHALRVTRALNWPRTHTTNEYSRMLHLDRVQIMIASLEWHMLP